MRVVTATKRHPNAGVDGNWFVNVTAFVTACNREVLLVDLTLRLLMSYIYIYIYIYIYMEHLFLMFLDHTQRRTTVGRTPLDE